LRKRNYGIDLLRIYSMMMIVTLHALGHGGVIYNATKGTTHYNLGWLIEIFSYCAVDCFGLISGFVGYKEGVNSLKIKSYIRLWFEVVFYCLIISILMKMLGYVQSWQCVIGSFFPVIHNSYWYFTAYTGMFFILPIINMGISLCDKCTLRRIVITLFVLMGFLDSFTNRFSLCQGYSVFWLLFLYIIGASIKKLNIGTNWKINRIVVAIILLLLITWTEFVNEWEFAIGDITFNGWMLVSYTSPTIVSIAILYIILFKRFEFSGNLNKIIGYLSSSSFAIYLLNDNEYIRSVFITDAFVKLLYISSFYMPLILVLFAIVFVLGAIMVDKVRIKIFNILCIERLIEIIEKYLLGVIEKVSAKL